MDVSYAAMSLTKRGQTVATFHACALAALRDLCANFTLFLSIFGANDNVCNYHFLGIYHIRAYHNESFGIFFRIDTPRD